MPCHIYMPLFFSFFSRHLFHLSNSAIHHAIEYDFQRSISFEFFIYIIDDLFETREQLFHNRAGESTRESALPLPSRPSHDETRACLFTAFLSFFSREQAGEISAVYFHLHWENIESFSFFYFMRAMRKVAAIVYFHAALKRDATERRILV